MSGCLDNDVLVAFASGGLEEALLPEVEGHLDECTSCRAAVAAVAHSHGDDAPEAPPAALTLLAPGTLVGRYRVEAVAGAGGMGVIYRAFDPTLNRLVALKLVRSDLSSGAAAERLLLEAKAMARVSHPDVMPVYDAGVFGEQLFIAMEWVDGRTLRAELVAEDRSVRELVRLFVRAGNGLHAAHRAGLVHRDFKPENVLLGKDGRIRVTDFGLAREIDAAASVAGTAAYMAPEVLRGEPATAAADQYAFCVALFEALSGGKRAVSDFEHADLRGSKALRRAILRGLSPAPEQRHASMAVLVAELERTERPARWWWAAAALLACGAGLVVAATSRADLCSGAERKMAPLWNVERRAKIVAAADERDRLTAERVAGMLDRFANDWSQAHRTACHLTRVTKEQSEHMLDLKIACLDQHLAGVAALIQLLEQRPAWDKVPEATAATTSLSRCNDAAFLLSRDASAEADPATASRLRQSMAGLQATKVLGPFENGRLGAERILAEATDAGIAGLEAEAHVLAAEFSRKLRGTPEQGKAIDDHLERAVLQGTRAHAPHVVAEAWLEKMRTCIDDARFDEAQRAWQHGTATLEGSARDPVLETWFELNLGRLRMRESRFDEALAAYQRATVTLGVLPADQARLVASALWEGEALVRVSLGQTDQAVELLTRATDETEANYGPDHPRLGELYLNLSELERGQGALDASLKHAQQSLRLWRRAYGEQNPRVAVVLIELARVQVARGAVADARTTIASSRQLLERSGLQKSFIFMRGLCAEGEVFRAEGELGRSEQVLLEALTLAPAAAGKYPLDEAECEFQLGLTLVAARKPVPARQAYERALQRAGVATKGGLACRVRVARAELDASEGRTDEALAALDTALTEANVDVGTQRRARQLREDLTSARRPSSSSK